MFARLHTYNFKEYLNHKRNIDHAYGLSKVDNLFTVKFEYSLYNKLDFIAIWFPLMYNLQEA